MALLPMPADSPTTSRSASTATVRTAVAATTAQAAAAVAAAAAAASATSADHHSRNGSSSIGAAPTAPLPFSEFVNLVRHDASPGRCVHAYCARRFHRFAAA